MKTCVIESCQRDRVPAALYCREHLNDLWHNRAIVVEPRQQPEWLRRAQANALPAKDYSRAA